LGFEQELNVKRTTAGNYEIMKTTTHRRVTEGVRETAISGEKETDTEG